MRNCTFIFLVLSLTAAVRAQSVTVPISDQRVLHSQGSVTPEGGEPVFEFDALAPENPFEPFDDAVVIELDGSGASFLGDSSQQSEMTGDQFIASGLSTVEVQSTSEGTNATGTTCSHFVTTFEVDQPAVFSLSGSAEAIDAPDGSADAYIIIGLVKLPFQQVVLDQNVGSGTSDLDGQGVLQAGMYKINVESHGLASAESGEMAAASASFDFTMTFAPTCDGDLDGDVMVAVADLLDLLGAWGTCGDSEYCPQDLDGDGAVGVTDLLDLLSAWGPCT